VSDANLAARAIPIAQTRPLRHAILRPHQTLEELVEHEAENAYAVGVFESDGLIAVGFVLPDGTPGSWRVRGMATAPEARGRGAGTAVLSALLGHATASGASRVWCNARVDAVSLYKRAGFRIISDPFDEPQIGRHYVMEWLRSADPAWAQA
jgi:ribosomal protein S18 acetylase RimI-like enzyme